jgi:mannose-6-phosphate isomerase-like protein (cupin superfamily)
MLTNTDSHVHIRRADAPTFALGDHLTATGYASPSRGARETAAWLLLLAPGAPGVEHTVDREEVFLAVAGRALVTVGGQELVVAAGDALVVAPGVPFSLANPGDEEFEAAVAFPVGGQATQGRRTFTPPWAE